MADVIEFSEVALRPMIERINRAAKEMAHLHAAYTAPQWVTLELTDVSNEVLDILCGGQERRVHWDVSSDPDWDEHEFAVLEEWVFGDDS